jgi:hypothetical protein
MLSPHTENFINCLSQLKLLFSAKRFSQSFISENPRAKQELHKTIENYSLCPRIMDVGAFKICINKDDVLALQGGQQPIPTYNRVQHLSINHFPVLHYTNKRTRKNRRCDGGSRKSRKEVICLRRDTSWCELKE